MAKEIMLHDGGDVFESKESPTAPVQLTELNISIDGQATAGDPTGFDRKNPTTTGTISFDDGTRTLTHAPSSADFYYYRNGTRVDIPGSQQVVIPDTDGLWFIYYNAAGTLTASQTVWSFGVGNIFLAIVYWNSTDAEHLLLGEERHGLSMSWASHEYLHETRGSQWLSGFTPSLTVDGSGGLDSHAEMQSISAGSFLDEDILNNMASQQTTYQILYKSGAAGLWFATTASAALVHNAPAGRPYYNEWTGATWQLTEVGNTDFTLTHIFATNSTTASMIVLVMGEGDYTSKAEAQDAALTEILAITASGLLSPEFISVGTVIIECKSSFSNTYKARVVSTSDGNDFVDFRDSEKTGVGASATHHGNLSGLADDDHPQYMKTWVTAPASASSTGTAGQMAYDSGYLYICTATDTWKRVAIATWT